MAMAYHMDALRKKRVIDRKNDALNRLMNVGSERPVPEEISRKTGIDETDCGGNTLSTDMGHFNNIRSVHNWTGRERNKRYFDHSRDGPMLHSTWHDLQAEYGFRKKTTPLNDGRGNAVSFLDLVLNRTMINWR